MVYPQCLLNFIELLYSQGAAHGNIVQKVLDILRKRDSPVPCFQSHPLTSLHERILPLKDTQKPDRCGRVFFYMFCLESLKARRELRGGVDFNRRILSFFILWHAHELDDMLGVFKQKCSFLFLIWVFSC